MSSESGTHWCYTCREPIILAAQNPICPNCNGGFIQELDDPSTPSTQEQIQRPRIIESISNFLRQQMTIRGLSNQQTPQPNNSFLIFSGDMPTRTQANGGVFEFLNEALGFRRDTGGDYYIGPGVEEFLEEATRNDRSAPPPVSKSHIESIPIIKISKKHVKIESTCAVCKEKFELSSLARKLPCKHIYHTECIVPWLEQKSSCPVCRHELTGQEPVNGGSSGRRKRWRLFSWPFGSKRENSQGGGTGESTSSVGYSEGDGRQYTEYSNWPFEY